MQATSDDNNSTALIVPLVQTLVQLWEIVQGLQSLTKTVEELWRSMSSSAIPCKEHPGDAVISWLSVMWWVSALTNPLVLCDGQNLKREDLLLPQRWLRAQVSRFGVKNDLKSH